MDTEINLPMSKKKAISEMIKGKKLTHTYFSPEEWIIINSDGDFEFEDGVTCDHHEFFSHRSGEEWNTGWKLYE